MFFSRLLSAIVLLQLALLTLQSAYALPGASLSIQRQPNTLQLLAVVNQPPEPEDFLFDNLGESTTQGTLNEASQRFKAVEMNDMSQALNDLVKYLETNGVHQGFADVLIQDIEQGKFNSGDLVRHALEEIANQEGNPQ